MAYSSCGQEDTESASKTLGRHHSSPTKLEPGNTVVAFGALVFGIPIGNTSEYTRVGYDRETPSPPGTFPWDPAAGSEACGSFAAYSRPTSVDAVNEWINLTAVFDL